MEKIDQILAAVRPLLPSNWKACEAANLSMMSGALSKSFVSISRNDWTQFAIATAKLPTVDERRLARQARKIETEAQAETIRATLQTLGYRVKADGTELKIVL